MSLLNLCEFKSLLSSCELKRKQIHFLVDSGSCKLVRVCEFTPEFDNHDCM